MLKEQIEFFHTGVTRKITYRLAVLTTLKQAVKHYEKEIIDALSADLGKSEFESYETEIGMVYEEISYTTRHLLGWSRKKRVRVPISQFPSKGYIKSEPKGNILIISPWNYPFLLAISPLIGAIAAGNTAVIKPSEGSPVTSAVIEKMIHETFEPAYIKVIQGGADITQSLLEEPFSHIFFTGSTKVGKIIAEKAAKNLIPVTLELGGKSPCIVGKTANIQLAAKRIIWGKFLNAGQTCVAPDFILCHESILEVFLDALKEQIDLFYPNALQDPDYPKIISESHFDRLSRFLSDGDILIGGETDREKLKIGPTVLTNVSMSSAVMQEEIFGPILPVMTYRDLSELPGRIIGQPLSLYVFTNDKKCERYLLNNISFGGGCINDTIVHLAVPALPFGGIGSSGMGAYHGKKSFETFSHQKSILKKANWLDIKLRYPPYKGKIKSLRRFLH